MEIKTVKTLYTKLHKQKIEFLQIREAQAFNFIIADNSLPVVSKCSQSYTGGTPTEQINSTL